MTVQDQQEIPSLVPILIYVPGLGGAEANSADRLADVVAKIADSLDATASFGTQATVGLTAPRGLSAGRTVVVESHPKLQVFQFDYASVLEVPRSTALPAVVPGMIRSAVIATWGFLRLIAAFRRKAKTARTKAQLLLGLGVVVAMIFAALVTLYALLVALGVKIPWLAGVLGTEEEATWTFGIASLGLTITWAVFRKKLLALAETAERLIRFARNNGQAADTISVQLGQAIDELRGIGWKGPLHLLGYSFGSLVLFEAMFPRVNSHLSKKPVETVSSLVTIGCPLDLVRLFEPSYEEKRQERKENLAWTNVFNEADLFASNLRNGDDHSSGVASDTFGTSKPNSIRYTDETIGAFQIFVNGRTHSSYWGSPNEANCFEQLVPAWLAMPQVVATGDSEGSAGAS
jgi:hypothetical protein